MAQSNQLLTILRGLSIALVALLIIQLGSIYDTEIFSFINIFSILGDLRDVFSYLLYILLYLIFMGLFFAINMIFGFFGSQIFQANFFGTYIYEIFSNIVGRWFYFPNITTTSPTIGEAWEGLKVLFGTITEDLYMVGLQILIIFMVYYAVRASYTSNPADAIKVVGIINVIIIIPLFFIQIDYVLTLFISPVISSSYPLWFTSILANDLVKPAIFADVASMTFWGFLTSKIFIVGLNMFIYLEFIFQLSYIDKVSSPTIEREERLSRQISMMHTESEKAIERIKSIEDMKREKRSKQRQARLELSEEDRKKAKKEDDKFSMKKMISEEGGATGFSYIADLIAKKKAEKAEQKVMDAMKDTRRVAHYLDKLFKQDPEARNTLTAKTSAPKTAHLVTSTIRSMSVRILLITVLTWACVHPHFVFVNIFRAPLSIANSVELQTYEGVLSLLIPFLLVLPLISNIIKITKHSKLQQMLRLEELRRAGLTEEEMQALEARRSQIAEAETQLAQDKDATADRAKKATSP